MAPAVIRGTLDGTVTELSVDTAGRVGALVGVDPPVARPPRPARGTPAGPVREHLQAKVDEGATFQWLVAQSRVSEDTIQSVLHGNRPTVYSKTAERLLAVQGTPPPPHRRVDPARTVARVGELVDRGWPLTEIARVAGLSDRTVQEVELASGVTADTEERIHLAWLRLRWRSGPAPRPYPWLGELIGGYPMTEVAAGAGVGYEVVRRLVSGRPVKRDAARAVCRWLTLRRWADRNAMPGRLAA